MMHTIKGAAGMVGLPALAHVALMFEQALKVSASGAPESAETQSGAFEQVSRAVHMLKGAASVIGLISVNTLAHQMEDLLDAAWDESFVLTAAHQQVLFETGDVLADLIGDPAKQAEAVTRRRELLHRYARLLGAKEPAQTPLRQAAPAKSPQRADAGIDVEVPQEEVAVAQAVARGYSPVGASRYVRVPIERLDEMVKLVSELVVSRSTFKQSLDAYRHDVKELRLTLTRLQG